ncbi:MAG: cation transporter [Lachnospiraceae bacterium]|nr:cation transporter [Lachnospiraceae bacterium]
MTKEKEQQKVCEEENGLQDQNNEAGTHTSGKRTLLWSVIMSSPGPLVVGLGLLVGRSSTQIADFVRRSSELLAIIMAFVTYKITTKNGQTDIAMKKQIEKMSNIFVGAMMCLGGAIMMILAFTSDSQDKGNVVPGLVIAVLGVIANTIFWRKYTKLNRAEPNPILAVQARLYGAKSLVDGCVTIALIAVVVAPKAPMTYYIDLVGSVIVAGYLILCGVQTIHEKVTQAIREKAMQTNTTEEKN